MMLSQTLFSFRGRINRAKWWLAHLLIGVATILIFVIFPKINSPAVSALLLFYFIFAGWISLAVNVKRWHDLDKSGWSELIRVTAFFELGFHRGTYGPNCFGPDPLESL